MNTPTATLIHSDCLTALRALPDNSVDLVLTDPPYGLGNTSPAQVTEALTAWLSGDREYLPSGRGFMGKEWDAFVPPVAVWDECLRVLKPGGYVLAAAGSRTQDLMGMALRLADFEIRDIIAWIYGSGFPKSMDVSKAIDKAAGAKGNVVGIGTAGAGFVKGGRGFGAGTTVQVGEATTSWDITAPATEAAKQWEGFGTALKPAYEPFLMARKPLEGTVAANVLEYGTGALNIDASRIGTEGGDYERPRKAGDNRAVFGEYNRPDMSKPSKAGRFPANVILDESQAAVLDAQSGITKSSSHVRRNNGTQSVAFGAEKQHLSTGAQDAGGASRFFYVAKAPKSERPVVDGVAHPTVKPLTLMRYLAKLACPPGGTILDPFAGSGTTIEAALLEGFNVIGIEREADYIPLIESRIARVQGTDELAAAA